ncbi:isoleucine--tRNA ligase [Buchnera aphidicola]|uniref:Isoleucine--tRNA ligase n=1 Tax=Buchnera aphidicola (Stegophylla sp.) TaxID=2315800 RepID=A0A4D6YKX2_9GAMM|nr:isoleucine--tRNA ligase [Buchnera aphidicola (Stegophylla sp.)]QCI26288.1 isoleucine--tRNA ligase [Buchnera aphidicola (Stegophylla sp.)]
MNHYKNTLNLPKTNFPMKGNLTIQEPNILKKWQKYDIYQIIRQKNQKKKIFLLHDGPPYANGNIHIGHAINKILKDIIIKSKTLSGFNTPYTPIWDCHGLPIEHIIEQKFGTPNQNITKNKFRNLCRNYAMKQVKKQKKDFIRLGIFANWKNFELTMSPKFESNVIKNLNTIIKNKHLYKGFKPVHWCLNCQSSLADAEVEYHNKISESIIMMFKIINNNIFKKIIPIQLIYPIYILIWTTTPWTLPANRAIAVHPYFKYQLIKLKKYYIIVEKKLVLNVMKKINIKQWTVVSTIIGKKLEFTKFLHPFLNFQLPIILSHHVNSDSGTGAVHIAPDYGPDDYIISKKYNINITNIINSKGYYKNNIHHTINKKNIFTSNKIIINLIKNNNLLLYENTITHSYPHCWRHKTPIIFRATSQWFINIENSKIKEESINQINQVTWIPKWGHSLMKNMLINRPDWCISRQRTWGIPIPIFTHKKKGTLHPETNNIIKKILNIINLKGSEIWWKIKKKDIIKKDYKKYNKSNDILDVWFESGCTQTLKIYNLENQKNITNMYLEGPDQYRGWFMSSLIISQAINKPIPYQELLTHGFAMDKEGKKMSKSIGNIITPNEIIESFGADILRLWVASTNYTNDVIISKKILYQISDNYRKIRNTSRFLLANIYDFQPNIHKISFSNMIILDKWIIHQTQVIQKKIIQLYNNYKFYEIVQKIIKFCSVELGSFYLDIIKDRQYTTNKNSLLRRSCQTAMYYIIHSIVRWITPILSFTADEIWNYLPEKNNNCLFTEEWLNLPYDNLLDNNIIKNKIWIQLFTIKSEVNKIIEKKKKNKKIKSSLETSMTLYINQKLYNTLKIFKNELKFIFLVSQVKIKHYKNIHINIDINKKNKKFKIKIKKYLGIKCPRCWNYFNQNNIYKQDKNLCDRCNKNIYGHGEKRQFV